MTLNTSGIAQQRKGNARKAFVSSNVSREQRLREVNLKPANVHVWCVRLAATPGLFRHLASVLSSAELERARQFRLDHLRRSYTIARGLLRLAVGAYLGQAPESLQILRSPIGKPYLPGTRLHFNMSDSHDAAMFGFALDCEVGVDIEHIRPLPDLMNVAHSYFTEAEYRSLLVTPEDARLRAFYKLWTIKEACLKSTGEGLTTALDAVEVIPDTASRPVETATVPGADADSWCAHDISPFEEYAACLAVGSNAVTVNCWPFADAMEAVSFCHSVGCSIQPSG